MRNWLYALLVFTGGCFLGALSTSVKLAYGAGFSIPQITVSQFFYGTALIWLVWLFSRKKRLTLKQTGVLLVSGIPMALTGTFYYFSLQTLDASLAIIFLFQFVWVGALFDYVFFRRRPTGQQWGAIAVLLAGSVLAVGLLTDGVQNLSVQGTVFGLLSAFTFTSFVFVSGNVGKDVPAVQKSAVFALGGLIFVCIVFPPFIVFEGAGAFGAITWYGLFLGLFGVTLPPLLFAIGMPRISTGMGTVLSASELPVAVVLSAVVLRETVGPVQWLGVAVILIGIVAGNVRLRRRCEVRTE
ncbi:EamA family transporter [Alteribacter natronophilus]|uniref:EamA family transporter n=1 Tax=Alteribacter natronophilus TaxID=2583810 RepID=UPI00110E12FF|nr:DMT family transporter [Alteribacter natronophilus]TMW70722.1 DMT family transporter [Alteribacter natronophilus]